MTVFPVPPKNPRYPGLLDRSVAAWHPWRFAGRTLLAFCVCAVLFGSPGTTRAQDGQSLPAASREEVEPCRGKVLPEPPCRGIAPPPCRGEYIPPPCRGDVVSPLPPPVYYRIVSLEDFGQNARRYLGMRVRLSGILARSGDTPAADQGYYIYDTFGRNNGGRTFGCPLDGSIGGTAIGSRVVVEGVVIRRRGGNPRTRSTGQYYLLSVERIDIQDLRF